MKNVKLLISIVILFAIQSCNDSSNPVIPINENFIYPLKIGNKWNYHISNTYTNVRPDSIKNKLNDFLFDVQVSVNNDTVLNSIPVIEMKEESENYPDSYAYYSNSEEGFLDHAYSYDKFYSWNNARNYTKSSLVCELWFPDTWQQASIQVAYFLFSMTAQIYDETNTGN